MSDSLLASPHQQRPHAMTMDEETAVADSLDNLHGVGMVDQDTLERDIIAKTGELVQVQKDEQDISERIRARKLGKPLPEPSSSINTNQIGGETEREYLIRTGKITPFAAMSGFERTRHDPVSASNTTTTLATNNSFTQQDSAPMSHVNLKRPSWSLIGKKLPVKAEEPVQPTSRSTALSFAPSERSSMKKAKSRITSGADQDDDDDGFEDDESSVGTDDMDSDFVDTESATAVDSEIDSKDDKVDDEDYTDLQVLSEDDDFKPDDDLVIEKTSKKRSKGGAAYKFLCEDDGDEMHYQKRLSDWAQKRRHLRWRVNHPEASMETDLSEGWDNPEQKLDPSLEMTNTHPNIPDAELEGGFRIPGDIFSNLFDYQKTCTQWLWELHCQGAGGIIGDEMASPIGLGKTIQIISFLAGLHYSGKLDGPVVIVCPATLLKQWVKEFHRWWPPLRVAILHSSGSGMHGKVDEDGQDEDSFSDGYGSGNKKKKTKKRFGGGTRRRGPNSREAPEERTVADTIVDRISAKGHVLVTTYAGLRIHSSRLLRKNWSYIVLDEGHKIRNPDADITLTCKQFRTPHRIILSGTPIQNNLNELWSLFDFVFPGRLGTLPVFQSQFAIPINLGGYANASNVQVQTAYKCAVVLRDLINPYLLRRMKVDVATDMPKKSEQVLFCKLTPPQRAAYEDFLRSNELTSIMNGKRHALFGIDVVRKICNHADILGRALHENDPDYGDYTKSGKMVVVKSLLQMWRKDKHRILLFSQTRTMLDILEKFIKSEGYTYRRMDGTTPIQNRMGLVDEFNARDDIYVFLLTTKVGGLGVNLTGADRVIIFDPDWNPSTDVQARERAWRLGQTRAVTIYRLMTSGTIEEKIYHRQIFKQFLTNKILKDPKQRRFFKSHDMADLFTLENEDAVGTETGGIFAGSEIAVSKSSEGSGGGRSKGKSRSSKRAGDDPEQLMQIDGLRKMEKFKMPRESGSLPGGVMNGEDDEELSFSKSKSNTEDKLSSSSTGHDGTEANILSSLFEMSGVHSALKHDEIMDSAKQEHLIVEREATRVAERAMAALKESRKRRRRQDLDVPTWTGKSGTAGAPRTFIMQQQQQEDDRRRQLESSGPKLRFGTANVFNPSVASAIDSPLRPGSGSLKPGLAGVNRFGVGAGGPGSSSASASSSSLLAGMLERKRLEQGDRPNRPRSESSSPNASSSSSSRGSSPFRQDPSILQDGSRESLITKIRDYMLDQGGRVMSADLVAHFQDQLADVEQIVFKKMLKGIAVLEKSPHDGKGWWKLKPEYY
ncbi:hypothetical protein BGZ83_008703 [Gryganskiella cystojenkinii]|nr:hypothetical protein BGZ83_008703 [Gryganskiella cystojenkinii]